MSKGKLGDRIRHRTPGYKLLRAVEATRDGEWVWTVPVKHARPIRDMNAPHIRQATSQDAERLEDVYHSAYRENRELGFPAKAETTTGDDIREWLDGGRVYVGEIDQQVIGAVRIEVTTPERLKLSRLGVHEDWQETGIGSALLDHVEELARAEDFEAIWLTTPEDHPYLPAFYRDRGYHKTGDYPLAYREYDEVTMEKSLDDG
jgi:ribosomal protein S18 acetylase RimI-like enzyme